MANWVLFETTNVKTEFELPPPTASIAIDLDMAGVMYNGTEPGTLWIGGYLVYASLADLAFFVPMKDLRVS